nr:peroxisome biogenesis protein 22 [Allium cepa]UPW27160.1 peroxisome biogenesis protein 22 [Allium cepa]
MSDNISNQSKSLILKIAQSFNRKISQFFFILINQKNAGSIGALAGLAIALIFIVKLLSLPRGRPRRSDRVKRRELSSRNEVDSRSKNLNFTESPAELDLGKIVKMKLNGGRKMTIQLLGAILEETSIEELQKQATIKLSSLKALVEISQTCDVYLMETVLDDESEERILMALENAGLFLTRSLSKEKVLFCSTDIGRSSFVRQLEPDWHVDSNLEVVSQLARFIRNQLHISQIDTGSIGPNVFTSPSLEQYFSCL